MKTHTIEHALPAEIEFYYSWNYEADLTQGDYEKIQGLIRDEFREGQIDAGDTGTLFWNINKKDTINSL